MVKKVNRQFFSTWNPDMAYVFGFWFADGWMSQPDKDLYITFTSADFDHLQIIQSLMESEHKIYSRVERCYDLTLGSKQLWQDIYHLGGRPAKSLVAEMPSALYAWVCGWRWQRDMGYLSTPSSLLKYGRGNKVS